jgi:hypothetical protein
MVSTSPEASKILIAALTCARSARNAHISPMGEIRTVTTLRAKREEILISIKLYEKQIAQARADLAYHCGLRIFEASGDPKEMSRYVDTYRMFKRGEPIDLCKEVLASGPKSTRELALHVMAAKGLDTGDKVLAKAVASQFIHSLRMQAQRGRSVTKQAAERESYGVSSAT